MAIAVQVPNRDRVSILPSRWVDDRGLESTIAIAQQHSYCSRAAVATALASVDDDEVKYPVTIYFTERERNSKFTTPP
jgi:hypothetical protein